MKIYTIAAITLLVMGFSFTGQSQGSSPFRIGAHGAYSLGGDIEKSKPGFGIQAEVALPKGFGIELAVSRFSDEYSEEGISLDQDLTTIGLSVIYRAALVKELKGFLMAGVDYNIAEMDANANPAAFEGLDINTEVNIDDAVGYHVGVGLNLPINKNWELFTEYRYTFLQLEGDVSASAMGISVTENLDKSDYNFGLLKLGVNYLF